MKLKFQPEQTNPSFEITVLTYYAMVLIVMQIPLAVESFFKNNLSFDYVIEVIVWPIVFVLFNGMVFLLMKNKLLIRGVIIVLSGVVILAIEYYSSPGIIDPVYFFLASCQPCNVAINAVNFLHNQPGRFGYEEIHRDTY